MIREWFMRKWEEAEASAQLEIPWHATGNGKMCIDVDEWVKRKCFHDQVDSFVEFRKHLED